MKMARTNKVGAPVLTHCAEKPRSQKRDLGHPLNVWRLQFVFATKRLAVERSELQFQPLIVRQNRDFHPGQRFNNPVSRR
jgi:hypothetical protein